VIAFELGRFAAQTCLSESGEQNVDLSPSSIKTHSDIRIGRNALRGHPDPHAMGWFSGGTAVGMNPSGNELWIKLGPSGLFLEGIDL
jgi:hypothetical protein